MGSLEGRIAKLEECLISPGDEDWRQWTPKQEEAFLYRLRQTAWEVQEWEERTAAEAECLDVDVEEYQAELLGQMDARDAQAQGISIELFRQRYRGGKTWAEIGEKRP